MNERIRELAVEAGIISAEYNGFDPTGLTKAQRKFAELIVRECAESASYYGNRVRQHVLKHFGVEE
jgi:hypothetical protein